MRELGGFWGREGRTVPRPPVLTLITVEVAPELAFSGRLGWAVAQGAAAADRSRVVAFGAARS